jgi:hypothetical protein
VGVQPAPRCHIATMLTALCSPEPPPPYTGLSSGEVLRQRHPRIGMTPGTTSGLPSSAFPEPATALLTPQTTHQPCIDDHAPNPLRARPIIIVEIRGPFCYAQTCILLCSSLATHKAVSP